MSLKFGKRVVVSVFAVVSFLNVAQAQVRDVTEFDAAPLSSTEQFETLRLENATIRSRAQLDEYVQLVGLANTPLGKLSESNRAIFLSSLTFNEKGLTGLNYKTLESELTPTEIYRLTDLFGASRLTFMMSKAKPATALDQLLLQKGALQRQAGHQKVVTPEKCVDDNEASGGCGKDYDGYACAARASCHKNDNSICTSNC